MTTTLVPGKYRHYKGNDYQVYGCAKHSETQEALVVYRALYGQYDLWVRPLSMFLESVNVNGEEILRFSLLEAAGSQVSDIGLDGLSPE